MPPALSIENVIHTGAQAFPGALMPVAFFGTVICSRIICCRNDIWFMIKPSSAPGKKAAAALVNLGGEPKEASL